MNQGNYQIDKMPAEKPLRNLLNNIDEGFLLLDMELNIIEMNIKAWVKNGLTVQSEPIGRNLFECLPWIKKTVSIEHINSVINSGEDLYLDNTVFKDQNKNSLFDVRIYSIGLNIAIVIKDVTRCIRQEKKIALLKEQLLELNMQFSSIREDERKVIAQDIHDELGQDLTGIKFELAHLSNKIQKDQSQFKESINSVITEIDGAIQSVKKITGELRLETHEFHLISELIKYKAKDLHQNKSIKTNLSITPDKIELEKKLTLTLYRIFQESITNIIRHSKADTVDVSLNLYKEKIILNVKDNGIGIKADAAKSSDAFGLMGMKERCNSHGGEFNIIGYPGKGTVLEATIPL